MLLKTFVLGVRRTSESAEDPDQDYGLKGLDVHSETRRQQRGGARRPRDKGRRDSTTLMPAKGIPNRSKFSVFRDLVVRSEGPDGRSRPASNSGV